MRETLLLKSNRVCISLFAWATAFSTSCRFNLETTSKEKSSAMRHSLSKQINARHHEDNSPYLGPGDGFLKEKNAHEKGEYRIRRSNGNDPRNLAHFKRAIKTQLAQHARDQAPQSKKDP